MRALRQLGVVFAVGAAWAGCAEGTSAPPAPSATPANTSASGVAATAGARATLGALSGEVSVKRAAGDEWVAATDEMKLFENDKVRTARGASAQIRFTNGSSLTLGEDALVGIAEARPRPGTDRSDLTVLKGRIDAELTDPSSQSLVVSTPSATVRAGREIVFQ